MIDMRQCEEQRSLSIEFDPYVPFTATWRGIREILDKPIYVVISDGNGCLELKFHPHDRYLIEVVLVAAAGMQVKDEMLSPVPSSVRDLAPFLEPGGLGVVEKHSLGIEAYRDYLCVTFEGGPVSRWVGEDPVLLGQASNGSFAGVCVKWSDFERESLLTGS